MLPEKLTLEIVTPERLIFSEEVDEVILPSAEGYMGVRPGHAPLLASLDIGEVSYRVGSTQKYLAVSGGFAEVLRDGVEILAQTCEPSDEIDVDRAKKARERAEKRLQSAEAGCDFARAEVALKRAISRIQIHDLHR